jgi:hypothetical protein
MQPQFITLAPHAKNITDQRFGRLIALGPVKRRNKRIIWLCRCDCGNTTAVALSDLRGGHTQSCGCLVSDFYIQRNTRHGMAHDPLYPIWLGVIKRCTNPAMKYFADYGGRGIRICDEWRHDFQAFYDHVIQLPHYGEKGYTLDRIDNDSNYEPGNMRWATRSEQARNRRNNHMISFDGKTQSAAEWSEETKVPYATLVYRLRSGWPPERAFLTPVRTKRKAASAT